MVQGCTGSLIFSFGPDPGNPAKSEENTAGATAGFIRLEPDYPAGAGLSSRILDNYQYSFVEYFQIIYFISYFYTDKGFDAEKSDQDENGATALCLAVFKDDSDQKESVQTEPDQITMHLKTATFTIATNI